MASLVNSACLLFLPVALLLMLSPSPVAGSGMCNSIIKGFSECLRSLGKSLMDGARKDEDTNEIDSICRSWEEFHDCVNVEMASCPEQAAAAWRSLRQESKKMQFSGNLYDMCSDHNNHPASVSPHGSRNQEEINQESLRGRAAHPAGRRHLLVLLSPLLLLLFWI